MTPLLLLEPLVTLLATPVDQAPEPEDVKAGWTAFAVFLLLIAAVALLCWSMVRQLRKVRAAKDAGVYGDPRDGRGPDGGDGESVSDDGR